MTTLDYDSVKADVAHRFGLHSDPPGGSPLSIGAEIELIPQMHDSHVPVPIVHAGGINSVALIRNVAGPLHWLERGADGDPPYWSVPGGAKISFEPGGQIEISSARHDSASDLIAELTGIVATLNDEFDRSGVTLTTRGADEWNSIDAVPLQLHRPRYARMARYFDSIGLSGARMMRQTASVQINVETGDRPLERWGLLNSLAPYLVAIFANSRRYEFSDTGHSSYRSHLWRTLDLSRTGNFQTSSDPIGSYTQFALDAGAMFSTLTHKGNATFREWLTRADCSYDDWDVHLSTLFPEIRPKGFFEIRSTDMIPAQWLPAPIAFVAGLIYDEPASMRATELLRSSGSDLGHAGRVGQRDHALSMTSRELMVLAIDGCKRLGNTYISGANIGTLEEFADLYTCSGRCPGDDSTL